MARGRVEPTSFTAGRVITLSGTLYAIGATIPNAVVATLKHASALLSNRTIIPNTVHYPGKLLGVDIDQRDPYTLSPYERRSLGA